MIKANSMDILGLPRHIGIIMDGNGRWARLRNLPRTAGHREGLKTAKAIIKKASELGIRYITLYTFSTENWKRAEEEVSFLMHLIKTHLKKEYDFYRDNRIRVLHCGDLEGLPQDIREEINKVMADTAQYSDLSVILAINYGARNEIIRAVNRWKNNVKSSPLTEESFKEYLDQPNIPDPDLIIRTGGELRISNFLLWQGAYAEYFFSDKLWPDWTPEDLMLALDNFQKRERKFGGVIGGAE